MSALGLSAQFDGQTVADLVEFHGLLLDSVAAVAAVRVTSFQAEQLMQGVEDLRPVVDDEIEFAAGVTLLWQQIADLSTNPLLIMLARTARGMIDDPIRRILRYEGLRVELLDALHALVLAITSQDSGRAARLATEQLELCSRRLLTTTRAHGRIRPLVRRPSISFCGSLSRRGSECDSPTPWGLSLVDVSALRAGRFT